MSDIVIQVENLSKAYQLGKIGTGTISRDLERVFVTKILGKEDPFLKIGQTNDRTVKGTSDIVWSLKDINFTINQGDAVGVIGKNGAGKSTLLKILSRVTSPTNGNVKIKGRIASLLEVGTGFHPELSGRENIYLNGAILGMRKSEIKRKFDEIVDFAGVERYIDTPVKRYSSGMYVRLAFAVAAHLESEILIVDEVLAVGDAEFQKKCLGKMGDISKGEGRTILFVSHNMAAVQSLCSEGILLDRGCVKISGGIENVIDKYSIKENSYSKNFNYKENFKPQLITVSIDSNEIEKGNLVLTANFKSPIEINNPALGIVVFNNLSNPIFGTNTRMHNQGYKSKRIKEGMFKLTIKDIPLLSGHYYISLYFGDSINDFEIYDEVIRFELKDKLNLNIKIPDAKYIGSTKLQNVIWEII